jgi:DNA-binding MarR family transcriptional regulator
MTQKHLAAVTDAEYRRLAAFRRELRLFLRFSEEAALAIGIPPHQHQALLAIKAHGGGGKPPITVGALAEVLQIAPHSAAGLVQRLVADRLAKKKRGQADRRQVNLSLASRGEKILEELSAAHKEELQRLAPKLQALLAQFADD